MNARLRGPQTECSGRRKRRSISARAIVSWMMRTPHEFATLLELQALRMRDSKHCIDSGPRCRAAPVRWATLREVDQLRVHVDRYRFAGTTLKLGRAARAAPDAITTLERPFLSRTVRKRAQVVGFYSQKSSASESPLNYRCREPNGPHDGQSTESRDGSRRVARKPAAFPF
jgi:hypothetical protein